MAQVIKLVGLVDDGSPLAPRLPRDTARELQFPRLADVRIELEILTNSGVRVTGGSDLKFTLQARLNPSQPGPTLTVVGTLPSPGVGLIVIASADTQRFQSSRLLFDIWLTVNATKYQIVRTGVCRLSPNIAMNP